MKLYRPLLPVEQKLKEVNYDIGIYLPDVETEFEYLTGCDIVWKKRLLSTHYLGTLINGSCELCSLATPGLKLTVKDELRLWPDSLWIRDRVYTASGKQIIGNVDGVPYMLAKVTE
jgi:hypothetical protein